MESSDPVPERFSKCRKCRGVGHLPEIPQFPGVPAPASRQPSTENPEAQVEASTAGASPEDADRTTSTSAGAHVSGDGCDESWRDFTPSVVDLGRCLARTWDAGRGGQCRRLKPSGADVCASCAKGCLAHGRVDGPIPTTKLAAFQSTKTKKDAASHGSRDVSASAVARESACEVPSDATLIDAKSPGGAKAKAKAKQRSK